MRISTNTFYQEGVNSILNNEAQMLKTQEQVSTGQSMQSPADNPVAAAQVVQVSQTDAMNTQYGANRQAASDSLSLVDTTLTQVTNTLDNIRTIAVQAGDGTLNDSERATLATQLQSDLTQLVGSANATDAEGHYLFSGYQSLTQPFTQGPGGVQYNGDDGQRLVQVAGSQSMGISASGASVFQRIPNGNGYFVTAAAAGNTGTGVISPGTMTDQAGLSGDNYTISFSTGSGSTTYSVVDTTTNTTVMSAQPFTSGDSISFDGMNIPITGTPANGDQFTVSPSTNQSIFTTVQNLINTLNTSTGGAGGTTALSNGINQGLTNIDQALSNVLTQQGIVGAKESEITALNSTGSSLTVQYEATLSNLQNVDLNQAISNLSQEQINLEAAQKSFAQISGLSLFSYLQG